MSSHARRVLTSFLLGLLFGVAIVVATTNAKRAADWQRFEHFRIQEVKQQRADNTKLRADIATLRAKLDPLEDQQTVNTQSAQTAQHIADTINLCLQDLDASAPSCRSLPDLLRRYSTFLSSPSTTTTPS